MKLKTFVSCIFAASTLMLGSCSASPAPEAETEPTTAKAASSLETTVTTAETTTEETTAAMPDTPYLTLIGHASVKIKTSDGKVIYIDPAYEQISGAYDEPADIIIVTHDHSDHNNISLVTPKESYTTVTFKEAHPAEDVYESFDLDRINIDTVAAKNSNHDIRYCVGYVLTFDGITVYHAGDTSELDLINEQLKDRAIDYALYPIDGTYNMNAEKAAIFADSIGAKNNIPIHITSVGSAYDEKRAKSFAPQNALYIEYGSTVTLESNS